MSIRTNRLVYVCWNVRCIMELSSGIFDCQALENIASDCDGEVAAVNDGSARCPWSQINLDLMISFDNAPENISHKFTQLYSFSFHTAQDPRYLSAFLSDASNVDSERSNFVISHSPMQLHFDAALRRFLLLPRVGRLQHHKRKHKLTGNVITYSSNFRLPLCSIQTTRYFAPKATQTYKNFPLKTLKHPWCIDKSFEQRSHRKRIMKRKFSALWRKLWAREELIIITKMDVHGTWEFSSALITCAQIKNLCNGNPQEVSMARFAYFINRETNFPGTHPFPGSHSFACQSGWRQKSLN